MASISAGPEPAKNASTVRHAAASARSAWAGAPTGLATFGLAGRGDAGTGRDTAGSGCDPTADWAGFTPGAGAAGRGRVTSLGRNQSPAKTHNTATIAIAAASAATVLFAS